MVRGNFYLIYSYRSKQIFLIIIIFMNIFIHTCKQKSTNIIKFLIVYKNSIFTNGIYNNIRLY